MARLLLIDDDHAFRTMLGITLSRMGHTVTEAADGDAALLLHAPGKFDAVLTDLIMPNKEGVETILAFRRLEPSLSIIAMSGGGRLNAKDVLAVAKAMGAHAVLTKPINDDDLVAALNAVFART